MRNRVSWTGVGHIGYGRNSFGFYRLCYNKRSVPITNQTHKDISSGDDSAPPVFPQRRVGNK